MGDKKIKKEGKDAVPKKKVKKEEPEGSPKKVIPFTASLVFLAPSCEKYIRLNNYGVGEWQGLLMLQGMVLEVLKGCPVPLEQSTF